MTIKPHKKPTGSKNESETTNSSQLPAGRNQGQGTRAQVQSARGRGQEHGSRRTQTDTWSSGALEDRVGSHLSHPVQSRDASGQSKRRHRSSPHRSSRKLRHTPSTASTSGKYEPSAFASNDTDEPCDDDNDLDEFNSGDEYSSSKQNKEEDVAELERKFEESLKNKGFVIKKMGEDGACLFRAVADQVYGDQDMHVVVRHHTIEYMAKNADYFAPYVTEDFQTYLTRKRIESCHGNHLEIQAMCEMYNRRIEVYQVYSLEPINTFQTAYPQENEPIRLSYHRNVHYNSIVHPHRATVGVGLGLPGYQPGAAEKSLMKDAKKASENFHIECQMLEDKMKETDWEMTQGAIEEQVARESYLQFCRDQDRRAKENEQPRCATASCSSADDAQSWLLNLQSLSRSPEPATTAVGGKRSPRQRPGSQQNSPKPHTDPSAVTLSPKPTTSQSDSMAYSEGACATPNVFNFQETLSLMNDQSHNSLGISDWVTDDDDVLKRVLAQSQAEYLDHLRTNVNQQSTSQPCCSKNLPGDNFSPR